MKKQWDFIVIIKVFQKIWFDVFDFFCSIVIVFEMNVIQQFVYANFIDYFNVNVGNSEYSFVF